MSVTVAIFVVKKPELSRADFQKAYDAYLPSLRTALGEDGRPESSSRFYVQGDPEDDAKPLSYTKGGPGGDDFAYDVVAFLKFASASAAKKFQEVYQSNAGAVTEGLKGIAVLEASRVIGVTEAQ